MGRKIRLMFYDFEVFKEDWLVCMTDYFTKQECVIVNDRDKLIKEEKSTSTYENMLYSKQIIDTLNLSENIAVATSEYHMLRAKKYAQKTGLNPYSLPAKSIPILRVPYFTREVFGIWYMKIKEALQK